MERGEPVALEVPPWAYEGRPETVTGQVGRAGAEDMAWSGRADAGANPFSRERHGIPEGHSRMIEHTLSTLAHAHRVYNPNFVTATRANPVSRTMHPHPGTAGSSGGMEQLGGRFSWSPRQQVYPREENVMVQHDERRAAEYQQAEREHQQAREREEAAQLLMSMHSPLGTPKRKRQTSFDARMPTERQPNANQCHMSDSQPQLGVPPRSSQMQPWGGGDVVVVGSLPSHSWLHPEHTMSKPQQPMAHVQPPKTLYQPISTGPPMKRARNTRSRQSCVRCRKQKLKCDGSVPCARCVHRGEHDSCQLWHRPTGRPKKSVDVSESLEAIAYYSNLEGAVVRVLVPKAVHLQSKVEQQVLKVNQQLQKEKRLQPKDKQQLQKVKTVVHLRNRLPGS